MRVLVITNMYPPHHLGGYELSCRDTVERFRHRGHDVSVLTTTMRLPDVDELAPARGTAPVRRELLMYWQDHEIVRPTLRVQLAIERHNQRVLADVLDVVEPDVVSFWNMGAMSMAVLTTVVERRIPSVLVVCDDWLIYGPLVDPWARRFGRRGAPARLARRLTGVPTVIADLGSRPACFVSHSVRVATEAASGWSFPRWVVTGSGIDREDFPPLRPGDEAGLWRGRLLYVGRIESRKGVETAVRALALLSAEYTLEILGPGDPSYVATICDLIRSLGLAERVSVGSVPRPELRSRYLAADAFVFPSEWAEPFGLVPVEAMACGRPVIATGTGGSAEFLADGVNCLLFRSGDADALAAAIRRLAEQPALRVRIVEGGLQTATVFDADRLADRLEEWHVAAMSPMR
ncbi:MAG: glycosyltransferase [Acidimicrobiales bacterium]